jgi:hypothetical protein
VESSAGIISACLPTLAPLLRSVNFIPWRKNKSSLTKSPSKNIATIGGSGPRNRSKHSRFERLDVTVLRDENMQSAHGTELAISIYHSDARGGRDEESQESGDEILLKRIRSRIEVEGSEERR